MGESTCLVRSFSHPSESSREAKQVSLSTGYFKSFPFLAFRRLLVIGFLVLLEIINGS